MTRTGRFATRFGMAVGIWAVTFAFAVILQGCGGGDVAGPSPTTEAPAPVAAATPAPAATPGAAPAAPAVPEHDASVKGGFYSVTNTTGIRQFYCAASFGIRPTGDQGLHTYLEGTQNQGERNNGDVFSGQGAKTAACYYDRIQVDLTQSKDCKNFDWHNVLAAEVYKNPDYIAETWEEQQPSFGEWEDAPQEGFNAATVTSKCYKSQRRKRFVYEVEKCSKARRVKTETWETRELEIPCPCAYSPGHTITKAYFDFENDGDLDDADVRAEVRGLGLWKLELVASESNSASNSEQERRDSGTIKDSDSVTLDCNSKKELRVDHGDHSWGYWWYRVRLNGAVIFTSQRYEE